MDDVQSMTSTPPVVLTAQSIAGLPSQPLGGLPGVTHRVLWQNETSMAGVMTIAAGHRLGVHSHRLNQHHMWMLDGRAVILDNELAAGSYVHIPRGIEHDIDATGTGGCTVFYLYLRQAE